MLIRLADDGCAACAANDGDGAAARGAGVSAMNWLARSPSLLVIELMLMLPTSVMRVTMTAVVALWFLSLSLRVSPRMPRVAASAVVAAVVSVASDAVVTDGDDAGGSGDADDVDGCDSAAHAGAGDGYYGRDTTDDEGGGWIDDGARHVVMLLMLAATKMRMLMVMMAVLMMSCVI